VLQHLTPELIRRPDVLSHQNGCVGVNAMAGIMDDIERVAAKLALLLGDDSVQTDADGVHLVVQNGQQIELLLPHAYRARFGDVNHTPDSAMPRLGAMTLRVEDLGRTQDVLAGNNLPFDITDDGAVRVAPDYTCGVILDFTEKSAR